ncbi:hypothetical protein niasHT_028831 [Heterodera trifolii]|uniref:BTB domain-containing protein n=1 Tax=Heterodera trifolii TaxID=157864 RepID=A0ABD2KS17_9BILA
MSFSSASTDDEFTADHGISENSKKFEQFRRSRRIIEQRERILEMPAQNGNEEIPRKNLPKPEKLVDRMKVLLNTANGADIHFLVGEEKQLFRAHKHILMLASDVFEAMFRIDAKNTTEKALSAEVSNPVEVPDVEAASFKVMLSFIYAEDLSELNGQNAIAVLYAAKKYNIPALVDQCLKFRFQDYAMFSWLMLRLDYPNRRNLPTNFCATFVKKRKHYSNQRNFCALIKKLCRILERDQ